MFSVLRRLNFVSFLSTVALAACGTVAIYSAGHARERIFYDMWKDNLATVLFMLVLYFVLAFVDYRKILKWFSIPAYAGAIVLLALVLVFGREIYGGKRWLWFFQPSEISKLCIIALFAHVFGGWKGRRGFKAFLAAALLAGAPLVLIACEPDLGTALTLVPALAAMLLAAGVWRTGIVAIMAAAVFAALAVLGAVHEAEKPNADPVRREKILNALPLKKHQVKRVKTFLYPDSDPLGDGYTLRQAKISIGCGGFSGKGIGKGEANRLKFLPPSVSMNDFIFCVWAEETGFVGSAALISLYAALALSGVWIALTAADLPGRLLALGFSVLVFAHAGINTAMSVGMLPITGLPLPLMSSGRTFLVTVLLGLGLVQSVSIHNKTKEKQ